LTDTKKTSYNSGYKAGFDAGRKEGLEVGYDSGYTQGTEYGKSLILSEIDTRVQEAERTDKNAPLFKVKR
jgi:flagellar biosynthesis/type III secretory pathway protein FliH